MPLFLEHVLKMSRACTKTPGFGIFVAHFVANFVGIGQFRQSFRQSFRLSFSEKFLLGQALGSAGDRPAAVEDPPTGTTGVFQAKSAPQGELDSLGIPSGESSDGAGW